MRPNLLPVVETPGAAEGSLQQQALQLQHLLLSMCLVTLTAAFTTSGLVLPAQSQAANWQAEQWRLVEMATMGEQMAEAQTSEGLAGDGRQQQQQQ